MKGENELIQLIVSILLYFVIFFGIAFILNMLLRTTWLMTIVYPFVVAIIIDNIPTWDYFSAPGEAFSKLANRLAEITIIDISILAAGFVGTIVSGIVIRLLRKSGYQMF
ncbi:YuiB family protein [Virgibacillus proomii]|uniref:YuiB family protein n=1 Tax=Virgibacillus proomii TaxID=84407 RepID=UPI003CCC1DAA